MPLLHQMDITLLGKNFRNIYIFVIYFSIIILQKKNLKNDMKFAQDEEPVLLLLLN